MNNENQNILEPEECFKIIKKKLCLNSMENFSYAYEFEPRKEFSGFLGQYFNLKVTLVNRKSSEVRKLNFFVKMLPKTGVQYDFVKETGCFETEHGLYVKIFPKILTSVEKNCIPECFLGLKNYALVLEDMSFEGYRMLDKYQFLQLEHLLIIMKNLAWFHARSLIFEEKNRITIMEFCQENKILINMSDPTCQLTLNCFSKNLMAIVDFMRNVDKKEECKAKIAEISSKHFKKTAPSTKFRNVLCHADLWTNNILFKYNEIGKVKQCCFIDFQMARYCPPAYDLLYSLYCTTSKEFRKKQCRILFATYYETLMEFLKEAEMDVGKIFSFDDLIESIREIKLSCMVYAFAIMSVSLLGSEASDQRTKELLPIYKIVCEEFEKAESYRNRMLDNLLDLYDNLTC